MFKMECQDVVNHNCLVSSDLGNDLCLGFDL